MPAAPDRSTFAISPAALALSSAEWRQRIVASAL